MPNITGSDIAIGTQVKWYSGATMKTETLSIAAGDVTATYKALGKKAEYGSVVATKNGVLLAVVEKQAAGAAATEATGTSSIGYTGITAGDSIVVQYIDIETSPLVQIATCLDVKTSISADSKSASIHGQVAKLRTVGAIEIEAELEQFQYSQDFISLVMGDQVANTPATGMNKITTMLTGVKKIPVLVGKRYTVGFGTVLYKWMLIGAQATEIGKEFPVEDMYKNSMKFAVDEYMEVDLVA